MSKTKAVAKLSERLERYREDIQNFEASLKQVSSLTPWQQEAKKVLAENIEYYTQQEEEQRASALGECVRVATSLRNSLALSLEELGQPPIARQDIRH